MSRDFNRRFNISVDLAEAQRRFMNRAVNYIDRIANYELPEDENSELFEALATAIGEQYQHLLSLESYHGNDFLQTLLLLEATYEHLDGLGGRLDSIYNKLLSDAEVDLGVRWERGRFVPAGARVLDEALVNDPLHWLRDKNYLIVLQPFEKGLRHLLESMKRPELLADVVTDLYEALEAMAKIVTDRHDKDLSANAELFLSKTAASESFKPILRAYIEYANKFRHAASANAPRPKLSYQEAESFLYMTGTFLRLAMR